MTYLLLLVAAVACGWLTLIFLDVLVRRPAITLWLVLVFVVLDELIPPAVISVELGGFRVSPMDVGFALVAAAAILRVATTPRTSLGQWALLLLGGTAVLSLVIGTIGGDVGAAVNEFRSYLGLVAAAIYFSTTPRDPGTRESMTVAWMWVGLGTAAMVFARWSGRVLGIDLGIFDRTYDAAIRVINGPETMFLATAGLILLLPALEGWTLRPKLQRYSGLLLLVISIVLNRRTLWIALFVGLAVLLLRNSQVGRRLAVVGIAGALMIGSVFLFTGGGQLDRTVAQSATDAGTLDWRVEGWRSLLASGPDEPAEWAIGLPFGSGFSRLVEGNQLTSAPHSFYLQTYLRTGLIGLVAFLMAMYVAFRSLLRAERAESGPLTTDHLLVLLAMLAVWNLVWSPGAEQGVVLGLALATSAAIPRGVRRRAATRTFEVASSSVPSN